MEVLQWILFAGIILTSVLSVINSFKSRRAQAIAERGLYAARTNIYMGIMLMLIALIQMLMFSGSTLRVIIGAVFLVIGLFNLFAGLRNRSAYQAMNRTP
ncbi:conserved hypothetical protein [Paenibacillus curdlanolyticus YK9]|uniref:YtpI-like protein n=1 Tax=Paenibacillus curdlanolyticus YK9 TaxID=717606 RepID=E0IC10_9BACL|nr:YtpI family protein [Paenibacillus curdlanolyticus]EFM10240.1 conserved hypothetical protein [Paenibacillus curdlanolyticus YK9]